MHYHADQPGRRVADCGFGKIFVLQRINGLGLQTGDGRSAGGGRVLLFLLANRSLGAFPLLRKRLGLRQRPLGRRLDDGFDLRRFPGDGGGSRLRRRARVARASASPRPGSGIVIRCEPQAEILRRRLAVSRNHPVRAACRRKSVSGPRLATGGPVGREISAN